MSKQKDACETALAPIYTLEALCSMNTSTIRNLVLKIWVRKKDTPALYKLAVDDPDRFVEFMQGIADSCVGGNANAILVNPLLEVMKDVEEPYAKLLFDMVPQTVCE